MDNGKCDMGCASVQKESKIFKRLNELDDSVTKLSTDIDALASQLEPIRNQMPQESCDNCKESEVQSNLAARITQVKDKVESINFTINALKGEIEL